MKRWTSLLAAAVLACGDPAPAPTPAPAPAPAPIGWDHLPTDPDRDARAANAAALRIHGHALGAPDDEARRVYEGSLAAFEAVAREHPDYLFARYNAACALSRLGRADEAAAILRELLHRDLPTFGPRLESDPDLAPLASSPRLAELTTLRDALAERYAATLREGVPMVHVTPLEAIPAASADADERRRRTFQAGVWVHASQRFVPMAPRLVREVEAMVADLALTAMITDVERGAVLSFEGAGTWSEGGGPIDAGELVVYEAGTGRERAHLTSGRGGSPSWCPPIAAHATATGGAVRFVDEDAEDFPSLTRHVGDTDYDAAVVPSIAVTLAHASVLLPHGAPPEGVALERDMIVLGEARVALPPAHMPAPGRTRTRTATWLARDASSHWLLTAGIDQIEWDSMTATGAGLSIVRVVDGVPSVTVVQRVERGVGALVAGPDAAYAQLGERTWRLPALGEPEPLPAGLVILAGPPGAY